MPSTADEIRAVVLPIIKTLSEQHFSISYFAFSLPFIADNGDLYYVTISARKKIKPKANDLFDTAGKFYFDVIYQEHPEGKFIPIRLPDTK